MQLIKSFEEFFGPSLEQANRNFKSNPFFLLAGQFRLWKNPSRELTSYNLQYVNAWMVQVHSSSFLNNNLLTFCPFWIWFVQITVHFVRGSLVHNCLKVRTVFLNLHPVRKLRPLGFFFYCYIIRFVCLASKFNLFSLLYSCINLQMFYTKSLL